MKLLILFLTLLVPFVAKSADSYLLGQFGHMKLIQDEAVDNKVYPAGFSYAAGMGVRKDYLEFEGLLLKGSGEGNLTHDGQDNKLVHE